MGFFVEHYSEIKPVTQTIIYRFKFKGDKYIITSKHNEENKIENGLTLVELESVIIDKFGDYDGFNKHTSFNGDGKTGYIEVKFSKMFDPKDRIKND